MFFRKKAQSWEKYMARENDYPIEKVSNEVNEKLSFMGIDQVTCTHIRKVAPVINRAKGEIVKEFYERITAVSKLKELIDEHSTVEKLKQTMVRYLEQFLKADIDEAYLESRFIVGKIHSKINLTIEHFLAAHHFLTQSMITVVMTELNNRPDEMIKTVLSIQKLAAFDQQVISEVYMGDTFKSFLFSVSDTLDHTTQLDTSKQLIEEMDHMNEEVFNVSSATEQVSASILEVTNHSIKVSEGTDDALQSAERSREVVDETVKDINEVGAVYEQVLSQVELLNEEIDKTHHVVELIKEITEQTNLLALNASIEAARAGEHGAGFAVVAQEVRNLAEHTNEQTIQISRNMASLQNVANVVTGQMSNTEELIKKSVDGAQVADQALDEIVTTMQEINESTAQIAAMSEEQTSAVSEIAQSTANVLNLSKSSQTIANTTAKVIFEISELMEKNRQQFMSTNIELQSKDIVRVAKTDHLLWKWRVYNMLLGLENLDSTEVTSHTMCRLGKWYYGSLTEHLKDSATFKQLEEPHIAVHEYAQQAAEFYEQDDYEAADRVFDELTEASNTVIELLTQLENEL